jgi:pimeloyl-ACP methyl ester carboxylesterase
MDELLLQRRWLTRYGGDVFDGKGIARYLWSALWAPEYTLLEKVRYWGCLRHVLDQMWSALQDVDLTRSAPRLDVPVYFFTGHRDFNTPFQLVQVYVQLLQAPRKEIVWFPRSAHNPPLEEPERFQRMLIEKVLAETSS